MEIERKFLIKDLNALPFRPEDYPHRELEQGYLCTEPVVRIRKDADQYFLTYKSTGLMIREEYKLETDVSSDALYLELDLFHGDLAPLVLAEIEFPDETSATSYCPPEWLNEEVTNSSRYHNSTLSATFPK